MARNQQPRRADQAQTRLTPQGREKLRAVVFDANAYGHARPDFDQLGRWAKRLAGMEIETWVPEPVAWEWAEHLVRDWEFVNSQPGTNASSCRAQASKYQRHLGTRLATT
ncbi:hypothetical protein [Streptomyces sp. NPDC007346]|uniref:hypothetical protein n=1 Tax=Streptomyces sp. NPDC007346 TaxID=3154682 RepID=UPI003456DF92